MMTNIHKNILKLLCLIDEKINRQVNAILHHPDFQRLEGSFRGLSTLVEEAGNNQQIVIRLLSISMKEFCNDLEQAIDFDASQFFKKIYQKELDMPGGQPFGLLIGDYYFSNQSISNIQDSIGFLLRIARIAAAVFAPFISGVHANFFGVDSYAEFPMPFRFDQLFQSSAYSRWQKFCRDEDMRFVGLILPRILMRSPYNQNGIKFRHRFFQETSMYHQDYVWGNSCYYYARAIIRSFMSTGWFLKISGLDLPCNLNRQYPICDHSRLMPKTIAETVFTDKQEKSLSDLGFIAFCDRPLAQKSFFYSALSVYLTQRNDLKVNGANDLQCILCVSRFAHHIKVIMRDKIGKFISAEECERYLNRWLQRYCASAVSVSEEARARYPLSEARVSVQKFQRGGFLERYHCVLHLKLHGSLEELQLPLHLVSKVV